MTEKVFITGGSGLLATNWAIAIRDRFSVVLGIYDRHISIKGVATQYANLESVIDFTALLKIVRPNIVIHTAGLTNIEMCEANPVLAKHVNVELSTNVAKVCSNLGIPLVHISTDHLFPGDDLLLEETYPPSPVNVYGKTKAEAELQVLQEYPETLVIRTNFYCWGPTYRQSFSDTIIQQLRAGNEIVLFKDVYYTPILAKVLSEITHVLIDERASGIYHVVGDERISKFDFGIRIAKRFKFNTDLIKPIFLADNQTLVKRPLDMSLSNKKVCNLVGKTLGGVDEHVFELYKQEQQRFANEIQCL